MLTVCWQIVNILSYMDKQRTPKGQKLTSLILEIFRVNGALLSAGDADA